MPSAPEARHLTCSICSQLSDREEVLEHVQASDDDTHLPEAASKLQVATEIQPGHPGLSIMRCPECRTYHLFRSVYEFLIGFGGSYDEYFLWRLPDEIAADYLAGRRSQPLKGMV